jgi:hypothetical protein
MIFLILGFFCQNNTPRSPDSSAKAVASINLYRRYSIIKFDSAPCCIALSQFLVIGCSNFFLFLYFEEWRSAMDQFLLEGCYNAVNEGLKFGLSALCHINSLICRIVRSFYKKFHCLFHSM